MSDNDQKSGLPVHIPWTLIASTREMMDRLPVKEDGKIIAPPLWRSSIAVYAYEPKEGELDHLRCGDRITFIKVSCSITGYQLSKEDAGAIIDLTDRWDLEIGRDIQQYFACHGVLVNISVFPHPLWDNVFDQPRWSHFPHIIDFEPKKRDLYEAVTEKGEVLTASKSTIKTDKSLSTTEDSQTGVDVGAEVPLEYVKGKIGLSQKWGMKATDSINISSDSSSERRETQGTSTNLSQMYNLLTGYHVGTNRATFLMLPRPHTVQPTLRRTFVQGFREIEGIQDFFLIVARPKDANALCIQTSLETGHIVETAFDVADDSDKAFWEYRTETVTVFEQGGILFKDTPVGSKSINKIFHIITPNSGWEFDPDKGDPGRVSVEENIIRSQHGMQPDDDSAYIENGSLNNYSYFISAPDKLIISATISWNSLVGVWAQGFVTFHRQYKLFLRRRKTISNQETYAKDRERLVITHRDLTVCAKFDDGCPKQIRPDQASGSGPDINDNLDVFIVDDVPLKTGSRGIELSVLQEAMTAGTSSPSRSARLFRDFGKSREYRISFL